MKLRCLDHFRKPADDTGTAAGWRNPIKIGAAEICGTGNPAPVLHFGSVFRQPRMFPNIVAMPMPTPEHLYCIEKWAIRPGIVCRELRARTSADDGGGGGGLVFGEEAGLAWEVSFFDDGDGDVGGGAGVFGRWSETTMYRRVGTISLLDVLAIIRSHLPSIQPQPSIMSSLAKCNSPPPHSPRI